MHELSINDENIFSMFNYVMGLVTSYDRPTQHYQIGLAYLEEIVLLMSEEAQCLEFDLDLFQTDAKKLMEKYKGDILPALNYLSRFTYDLPKNQNS